jgi:hypothetical protein
MISIFKETERHIALNAKLCADSLMKGARRPPSNQYPPKRGGENDTSFFIQKNHHVANGSTSYEI